MFKHIGDSQPAKEMCAVMEVWSEFYLIMECALLKLHKEFYIRLRKKQFSCDSNINILEIFVLYLKDDSFES